MDKPEAQELRDVVVLLSDALALADRADETLLGAKIDEALECAWNAIAQNQ